MEPERIPGFWVPVLPIAVRHVWDYLHLMDLVSLAQQSASVDMANDIEDFMSRQNAIWGLAGNRSPQTSDGVLIEILCVKFCSFHPHPPRARVLLADLPSHTQEEHYPPAWSAPWGKSGHGHFIDLNDLVDS